ncbi:MAG: hypothetical protein KDK78_04570 [Chlamydiia bacterium]|nr:hypothetical protein [Chlamydiia bacterium]
MTKIALRKLAIARSGDKGSSANIGLIARSPEAYQILCKHVTAERVQDYFRPLGPSRTRRFELPKLEALNFLMDGVLAGGGSLSLRLDSQGKALGQALLELCLDLSEEELRTTGVKEDDRVDTH